MEQPTPLPTGRDGSSVLKQLPSRAAAGGGTISE